MIALGGRKFVFALICMIVGTLIELKTEKGISIQFTTLLVTLAGMFNLSNVAATKTFNETKTAGQQNNPEIAGQVAELHDSVNKVGNAVLGISQLLTNVANNGVKK